VKYRLISGLSLIEVMISLSLSMMLLMILLHLYLQNQQSTNSQNSIMQLNHELTMTSLLLREDIHQAGYIGCPKLTADFSIANHTGIVFDAGHALLLDTENHLLVQHAQLKHAILYGILLGGKYLEVSRNKLFQAGDILILSDCKHAEIIRVLKVTQHHGMQQIELTYALRYKFSKYAELARLSQHTYFLQDHHLYVQTIKHRKLTLMRDVNQFNIQTKDGVLIIQLSLTKPFKKTIFINASKNTF
jgi:hypothetical protein